MKSAIERRQKILEILSERRYEKMTNLAIELSVSRRTICYDIEHLSSSFPLYTETGTYGGVYVADGFKYGMKYLTDRQCDVLDILSKRLEGEERSVVLEILKIYKKPQGGRIAKKKNT